MIIDNLKSCSQYYSLLPELQEAFSFLERSALNTMADGKYPLRGDSVYASVATNPPRTRAESPLEAHRKYIDLQYIISGVEEIGWRHLDGCHDVSAPYSAERDIAFFRGEPTHWLKLVPGTFAIFFPHDAHAPGASASTVKKVVVKIACGY